MTKVSTTTTTTRKRRTSRPILNDLAAGETDLQVLATRHKMTQVEMARWIRKPSHAELLHDLELLADRRAALIVAGARAAAAKALLALATDAEAKETQRKACVDLLKLGAVAHFESARDAPDGSLGANAAGMHAGSSLSSPPGAPSRWLDDQFDDADAAMTGDSRQSDTNTGGNSDGEETCNEEANNEEISGSSGAD